MGAPADAVFSLERLLDISNQLVRKHPIVAAAVTVSVVGFTIVLRHVNRIRTPIPGIPYNPEAVSYVLGDVPQLLSAPNLWMWWATQGQKHQSPLTQVFMRPFARPWVLISDPWVSADISNRRAKEFDRSDVTIDALYSVIPGHHITLKSTDPHFKKNKELVRELMSPSFVNEVTAPQIYRTVLTLLDLWRQKMALAEGRPFEASDDIHNTALDVVLGASFGFGEDKFHVPRKLDQLKAKNHSAGTSDASDEKVFEFEDLELSEELQSFTILIDSLAATQSSPLPRLHHFVLRTFSPKLRRAAKVRQRQRDEEVANSLERRRAGEPQRCAMDQLLAREDAIAAKEGREPDYHSQTITSEVRRGHTGRDPNVIN